MNFLVVFLGGGIGCLLRYVIGLILNRIIPTLPLATFISNVLACFVFGVTMWIINANQALQTSQEGQNSTLKLLILTGFCGGLSTFSTFGYETFLMFKQGLSLYAFLNIVISIIISLLIFYFFIKHIR